MHMNHYAARKTSTINCPFLEKVKQKFYWYDEEIPKRKTFSIGMTYDYKVSLLTRFIKDKNYYLSNT